ncbi:hypothetical protein [Photobacterium kasasachensis]|uniref:hypothetical protein n=1 Tax=Photobacterium kasasachensis TaxID=2910240 RepID=UPI003D0B4268
MKEIKTVNVLVDNDSWILPYAEQFVTWCNKRGVEASLSRHQDELREADVSFFLGCVKLVHEKNLVKSRHNLVVHESDLPKGKGFAPVAWQIIEGQNVIPVCLIEASKNADSGDIWLRDEITLDGTELNPEWRNKQGTVTIDLCQLFVSRYSELSPESQVGEESFYTRRRPEDSELNMSKTLAEQFQLLRVVDNDSYPAFFRYKNKKYKVEITEYDE